MIVGFVGLGAMGRAMARNLLSAGHEVRAWNRSGAAGLEGLIMVGSPAEAFQAEVTLTMLSDDAAIRTVLLDADVLRWARPGLVHVVMSTISVAFARELTRLHEAAGVGYVSAPVLGRPDVAARGELNILVAGRPEAVETARPLLAILGRKTWPIGADPAQSIVAKIAANMMIVMAIQAMAEAVVLTESAGVAREIFFDLIMNTLFSGRVYETYSANIAGRRFEPGFKARLGLKDLGLAAAAGRAAGRTLPMLAAVQGRMAEAVGSGLGEKDWSAMADFTINDEGAVTA